MDGADWYRETKKSPLGVVETINGMAAKAVHAHFFQLPFTSLFS